MSCSTGSHMGGETPGPLSCPLGSDGLTPGHEISLLPALLFLPSNNHTDFIRDTYAKHLLFLQSYFSSW